MEESGFVLHETFSSESEAQRKERFQDAFGRYVADSILRIETKTAYG